MKVERRFSVAGKPVAEQIAWKLVDVAIKDGAGKTIFARSDVEVPAHWSDNAAQILANKYFRKAGVPRKTITVNSDGPYTDAGAEHARRHLWNWLWPRVPLNGTEFGAESSAKQVFHRLAGCWTYWGWRASMFPAEEEAQAFYDECYMMLARQVGAPNSPQWFNTGLHWAYGIEGPESGMWAVTELSGSRSDAPALDVELPGGFGLKQLRNSYERPQPHACFIQPVKDDLVNPGGIMDLWVREVRLFKHGSGTGSNFSSIRGKGESLSGGGVSSGLMSFLRIGDQSAGSIASGGVTRRAAKMVILDLDHPEVEEFVNWKVEEEYKAACMATGARLIREEARTHNTSVWHLITKQIHERTDHGFPTPELSEDWEGEAINSVSGQNSNNSVRVPDAFMALLDIPEAVTWNLKARTTGKTVKGLNPKHLWEQICRAAWASADPGVQFHDTVNAWHTCSNDGQIQASNPCSEYMFLDSTACNLASLNLCAFLGDDGFNMTLFMHAVRLWTMVLDISVTMASFPSAEIALGSYNYRTLGLGYANLGGLLMRNAMAYASEEGRALAAAITALMHFQAYKTSQELAEALGPFPRWQANAVPMAAVLDRHREALRNVGCSGLAGRCVVEAGRIADSIDPKKGFRNAQVTLLAPTGTISFVMDCDTTGIEPDFALVKNKHLAGGGTMRIVNQAIEPALMGLGFAEIGRKGLLTYIEEHGCLPANSTLDLHRAKQVLACANEIAPMAHVAMVAAVQPFLSGAVSKTINLPADATVEDVDTVYRAAHRLGLKAVALYRDGSKLTQPLSVAKIAAGNAASTVEWERAANVESTAGRERAAWLESTEGGERAVAEERTDRAERAVRPESTVGVERLPVRRPATPQRVMLPWRREAGFTQKVKIDGNSVYLHVSEYNDGQPGEIFLELAHQGSTLRAMGNLFAIAVSIGLQHGIPVKQFIKNFLHTKFEPAGIVEGHDRIKMATSIADYVARELAITYLGRDDLANITSDSVLAEPAEPLPSNAAAAVQAIGFDLRGSQITGNLCPSCSNASLVRSGTCVYCRNCSYNTGCG